MSANKSTVTAYGPWVDSWGYRRAVRVGDQIEVSGTTAALPEGGVAAVGDAYGQAVYVFELIESALAELGASLADVVRTRVFLKEISDWPEVGRRHAELFAENLPTSSCIGGVTLLDPDLLLEVEATAVLTA